MFAFNICSSPVAGDADERGERDDEERGANDRGDRGIIVVICSGGGGGGGAVGIGVDVAADAAVVVEEDEEDVVSSTIGSVSVSSAAVCVDSDFCTSNDTRASKHQPRRSNRNTYHVATTRCGSLGFGFVLFGFTSDIGQWWRRWRRWRMP
jgi:hypothetical protein